MKKRTKFILGLIAMATLIVTYSLSYNVNALTLCGGGSINGIGSGLQPRTNVAYLDKNGNEIDASLNYSEDQIRDYSTNISGVEELTPRSIIYINYGFGGSAASAAECPVTSFNIRKVDDVYNVIDKKEIPNYLFKGFYYKNATETISEGTSDNLIVSDIPKVKISNLDVDFNPGKIDFVYNLESTAVGMKKNVFIPALDQMYIDSKPFLTYNVFMVYAQLFNVTYDANTGTGTILDSIQYEGGNNATVKDITGITKTGYTFTGWNTKADGTGTAYAANATLLMDANKTLYAQWTEDAVAQKYTVTYDANTGTGNVTDATQYDENTNATVKDITGITKTGYTFTEWNTKADGTGTAYAANATLLMDANKTLYAQWTEDTVVTQKYTVTYDANTGTGTVTDATQYDENTNATVKDITGIIKTGYTFTEWNTKADGTGTAYAANATLLMDANKTLYAQWTEDAVVTQKYTVTYDANTGAGTTTDVTQYDENTNAVVKDITGITKTGYTFTEWNTKADGTGTAYAPNSVLLMDANKTLYAQWTEDATATQKYTVTYDANTGTGTVTDATQYDENTNATVKDITGITKTGYTFTEWNTKADGTGTAYAANATLLMDANKTLYAQWTEDAATTQKYTVTYDANTGTGTVTDATQYDENTNAVVKDITGITKAGFTFSGWNTKADGTGTAYAANATLLMDANKTLYAQWTEDATATQKYTVTYDANTGTGTVTDATQYDENTNAVVKDVTGITKTGYTFSGWNTKADGTGVAYTANATLLMDANKTLYAQWTVNTYTIDYDKNGGNGELKDTTTTPPGEPSKVKDIEGVTNPGNKFVGWNTEPDGSGKTYKPGEEVTLTGNIKLYAQWEVIDSENKVVDPNNKISGNNALPNTGNDIMNNVVILVLSSAITLTTRKVYIK